MTADTLRTVRLTLGRIRASPSIPVALIAGVAGVVGSYALAGFTPGFVAAPIAGILARVLPGTIITAVILTLGSLGQSLNLVTAIVIAVVLLAGGALVAIHAGRRTHLPVVGIGLTVGIDWLITAAVTGAPVVALGAGVGAGLVVGVGDLVRTATAADGEPVSHSRRHLIASLVGVAGLGVVGAAIRRRSNTSPTATIETDTAGGNAGTDGGSAPTGTNPAPTTDVPTATERLLREADEKSLDVEGIEPLVSGNFYEVDINAVDPDLDADEWSLSITGAVDREVTLDYDEITSMPTEHRFVTLRCVGESLNGHKMDNALWTGIPVTDLIERAGPRSDCECVMLRAADDFYEEFPLDALRRGFLAFGMNGRLLPRGHGYPVRALIPGHWGEINVKWLTEIEFLDREADGYWEERGWHGTGPVNTVAKFHAINKLDDDRVQVGGHAYAGLRGIDRVEVSVDDGSWQEAVLSEPLPGDDVWRQWKYEYRPPDGSHDVVVRAVDGEGRLQPRESSRAFPSGATGWVSRTVRS